MGQTLSHGVYLPNEGERNCYPGLASNWQILNTAVGNIAEKAPLVHTHGNITNDGKVGTTANLPLITGTGGAVQAGSFGNQANTFCEGNDSRLSDARTPVAHTHGKADVTDLLNSNFIPSATNTYDLGSSSYQWKSVYAQSYYYNGVACGDILTHNASEFVDVSSNQTIGGVKTFSDIPIVASGKSYVSKINASRADGTQAGFSPYNGFKIVCNNDSQGWDNTAFAIHIPEYSPTKASVIFKLFDCIEGSLSYKGFLFRKNDNGFQFSPTASNLIDLGTSTNKWKSLNGVNLGALSLPDYTQYEPINFSQWNTSGALTNNYTPDKNGWLSVNIKDTATNSIYIYVKSITNVQSYSVSVYGNGSQGSAGRLATIIPVIEGLTYGVVIKAASVNDIYAAKFFPALGNV